MAPGDLRLTVDANRRRGRTLVFKDLRSGEIFPLPLTHQIEQRARVWRERLSGLLMPFHDTAGKITIARPEDRWRFIDQAVRRLREVSLGLLEHVTGGGGRASKLEEFLNRAIPETWNAREQPGRIQFIVDEENLDLLGIPIEYLPIGFSTAPRQRIDNSTLLQESLNKFAGFAAVVVHRSTSEQNTHNYLEPDDRGKLPAKVISYTDFHTGAQFRPTSETLWLKTRQSHCDVRAIWPDDRTNADDAAELLATCLFDPRFEFGDTNLRRSGFDQIQHFSCHYERPSEQGLGRLRLRNRPELAVELLSLRTCLRDRLDAVRVPDNRPPGPFVFVNACHSGATPSGLLSLVETLYLKTSARALLVTDTEVEFKLAAAFARCLYTELFRGRTVGEAVHRSRWELVLGDDNPFGILYSLYGDPELHCIRSPTGSGFISGVASRA